MNPAQTIYDRLRPVEVFQIPLDRPVGRRRCRNFAQVADLVGQLHQLCVPANVRSMLDLKPFGLCLG